MGQMTVRLGDDVETAGQVSRLTRDERVARGRKATGRGAAGQPRRVHRRPRPTRPGDAARGRRARHRVPELLPIRYGRMAVSAFAFFRGAALPMAGDLARHAAVRADRPALRGRPPGQLRRVRLPGAPARVRHQRLRRDPARARGSGTSNGWRRAWRSRAGTTATPRRQRRGIVLAAVAAYRRAMRRLRRAWTALEVWYAHADVDASRPLDETGRGRLTARQRKRAGPHHRQGPDQGQPRGAGPVRRRQDGRPRIDRGPAVDRADPRPARATRTEAPSAGGAAARDARRLPAHPRARAAGAAGPVPARGLRPQGRRRRQRGHPVAGWCCCSATTSSDPLFLQAKEAGPSVLEAFVGRQRVRQRRATGRGRAAADAGRQRHLPRLGPGDGHRRADPRLLPAPAARLEGVGGDRDDGPDGDAAPTASCAGGRSPARTPGPGTASRSRPTSAAAPAFDVARPASSPRPTPTRTSTTTRR